MFKNKLVNKSILNPKFELYHNLVKDKKIKLCKNLIDNEVKI